MYSYIKKTFSKTFYLLKKLKENFNYKTTSNFNKIKTNPLIWEISNINYYWNKYCLSNLKKNIKIKDNYTFNDRRITLKKRFFVNFNSLNDIEKKYHEILVFLTDYIINNDLNSFDEIIIYNSLIYNNNVNERIFFTYYVLNLKIREIKLKKNNNYLNDIIFLNISGGSFSQGSDKEECFDNEYPSFNVEVKKFSVSKYCITNGQYLEFVKKYGYKKNIYWENEGLEYLKEKKLECPLFWKKENDKWYEKVFGEYKILNLNHPVKNITYYEAKAFCRWYGCRLPTESEWEYLANNFNDDILKDSNLDDNIGFTVSVLEDRNINNFGVVGLFGNVWEWCNDKFYPYDGFKMDKIDRERSYMYFGNNIICRGGSFVTSRCTLTKTYRSFDDPINVSKFIGFRVVKI